MIDRQLDLSADLGKPVHTYAYYELREMRPGQTYELLIAEEPSMLMQSLKLQLRHGIHWEQTQAGPPLWTVQVKRREDVAAVDLVDLLSRDHLRLDGLFAQALHLINAGDVQNATAPFMAYAQGLRAHLNLENTVLVPAFDLPRRALGDDPISIMLREHDQILEQTVLIESYFEDGLEDANEVAAFFALISGALAKHESREETVVFPLWLRQLHNDAALEKELFEKAKRALAL